MKNNLNKVGKCCWSDMFTKIYRKTLDYCAGCNEHTDVTDFEDNKTLKVNLDTPLSEINQYFESYMYGSRCTLTISEDYEDEIFNVINQGVNVVVATNEIIGSFEEKKYIGNNSLLYCNYFDFIELITSNKYFISGIICIYFPESRDLQNKIVNIIENCIRNYEIGFLLFSDKDYFIFNKNKNLSELPIVQHCKYQ